jgi:hypothetical protein
VAAATAPAAAPLVPPVGTPAAGGTVTTLSTPIGARPSQTAVGGPAGIGAGGGTPGPVGTPGPGTPSTNSPTGGAPQTQAAAGTPGPSATPAAIQRGRIKPPDGGSARLRAKPSTDGGSLASIPNAAQIEILETVRGQDIGGDTRWLRVRYGNLTGYVSGTLVVVGE